METTILWSGVGQSMWRRGMWSISATRILKYSCKLRKANRTYNDTQFAGHSYMYNTNFQEGLWLTQKDFACFI